MVSDSSRQMSFNQKIRLIILLGALVCFSVFFIVGPMNMLCSQSLSNGVLILIISLLILLFCSLFFMKWQKIKSDVVFGAFVAISAAAIAFRLYLFDAVSNDYTTFLSDWLFKMRSLSGLEPITTPIGDYNMPYLYYLFVVSKLNFNDLYMIKLLSIVFDFVLALGAVKTVSLFTKNDFTLFSIFSTVLFVPTVFLNSAYWAQCDGIYVALSVWALYFALSKRPKTSMAFFALAFSFKIQTIFILPIIIFLLLKGKISLKHLAVFPIVFILTLLPSLLCGRSFYDTFSIYISQTSSYPYLTLNCPTFWALFPSSQFENFSSAALFLAGAACLAFGIYIYTKKDALNTKLLLDAAFIFVLLMPFFLPRMHERYFYFAEIFSVIYVFLNQKRLFVSPLICFTGYCVYSAYLFGSSLFSLSFLTIINAAVLIYVIKKFADDINLNTVQSTQTTKECC